MSKYIVTLIVLFIGGRSQAVDVSIRPSAGTANDIFFSDTTASYPSNPAAFTIKANVTCYSTNLRSVENPVSPTSIIRMGIDLNTGSSITLFFPAYLIVGDKYQTLSSSGAIVTEQYFNNTPIDSSAPNGSTIMAQLNGTTLSNVGVAVKNMITFDVPSSVTTIPISSNGSFDVTKRANLINRIHYAQDLNSFGGTAPSGFASNKVNDWGIQRIFAKLMRPLDLLQVSSTAHAGGGDGGGDGDGGASGDGGGDGGDGNGTIETSWNTIFANQFTKTNTHSDLAWFTDTWRFANWAKSGFAPNDLNSPYRYMGRDGAVTANSEYTWSSDFKTLNVNVSFPGQFGFCGGWFSPLMLFFDDQRPKFTTVADFKMSSYAENTYWPEKGSSGYFLVLDKNGDGIINDVSEMFGSEEDGNGFDVLAQFDDNNDGVIDERDAIYSQLKLWKDSTGTGKTLAKDLISLKQAGVTAINLKYQNNGYQKIGGRAELRETSAFQFVKNGKTHQGAIIDVWFASPR